MTRDLDRVRTLLAPYVAADELLTDVATLRIAACDALSVGVAPLAVLAPRSVATLVAAVPRLAAAGIAIVPRGAGLSYSGGAVCNRADWVAVDMRALDRVLAIDAAARQVRVEAGCTWSRLHAALAERGLRTPFWGPASGLHATVGGAFANDAIFFGSARHGTFGDCVRGATVCLADGRLLRTGVHVVAEPSLAVAFGPDLTRLFVGACGAFGIVVEITLPLEPVPTATRYAGYRCPSAASALASLAAVVAHGDATEAIVLDPAVTTRLDGRAPRDLGVPGRHHDPAAPFLLSFAIDAVDADDAELRLARATQAVAAHGAVADGEGLLRAFREHPFQPPAMLHASGRRWVPVHGIVAPDRASAALDALDAAMRAHRAAVQGLGLEWSTTCAAIGAGAVLVEANLTWPDGGNALLEHYLGSSAAAATIDESDAGTAAGPQASHRPARWRDVDALRRALADALVGAGATHLQIGRFYDYAGRLDPTSRAVLESLQQSFDPHGIMNPGVLGLHAKGQR